MTTDHMYYKVLNGIESCNGGRAVWHKPRSKNRPGKWMPKINEIAACEAGYHVCNRDQLVQWLGRDIWEVEVRGEHIDADDKSVWQQARLIRRIDTWNERAARLFACDCAEHVLPLFEKRHPDDKRPRKAIEIARRFADGEATKEELAAAEAAAGTAARYAAEAAAGTAAGAAAWAAARAAAWAAERTWQTDKLFESLAQ